MRSITVGSVLVASVVLFGANNVQAQQEVNLFEPQLNQYIVQQTNYTVGISFPRPQDFIAGDTVTVTVTRNNSGLNPPPLAGQSPPQNVPAPMPGNNPQQNPLYVSMLAPPARTQIVNGFVIYITDSYTVSVQYARANGTPVGQPVTTTIMVGP